MNSLVTFFLVITGLPLFAAMAVSAIVSHKKAEIDLQAIMIAFHQLASMPLLKSLPLFAFAGYLLAKSDAPQRLIRLSNAALGWLPGGLAIVAIWACSLVTAVTGASGVTIVALGGLLLPALREQGYGDRFSLGLITTGGSLGLLFPPSLPVILFGVVAEAPIEELFIAGALPGILILGLLSAYSAIYSVRAGIPRTPFRGSELREATWQAKYDIPLPFLIVIGIYSGFITVSEAAVITALYVLIVEMVIYRDLRWRELPGVVRESMVLVGGILIILGMTMAVTNYVIDEELPQQLFESIGPYMTSPFAFLLALNLFLLLVGCMIDIYAAIVLIVPLLIPIAEAYDINMSHLGIIFLTNMGIGYATPPVGVNLFIASVRFNQPILKLYWSALPFIAILLVALALITFVPALSLSLGG